MIKDQIQYNNLTLMNKINIKHKVQQNYCWTFYLYTMELQLEIKRW